MPFAPGVTNEPPSLANPSEIASSIAPEIAWPEFCATILVTSICNARSLALSAGTLTVCCNAVEVLTPKAALPP